MSPSERQSLIERLTDHILDRASSDFFDFFDFFADMLLFGRVGFTEMTDEELENVADLWGVEK